MFDTSVLDEAVKNRRERLERQRRDLLEKVSETLKKAREAYNIKAAYVIGSLARPLGWHRFSDVDVAVSGCSAEVLEVMKELERATGKEVDVVDLDRHPSADSFRREGLRLYG